MFEFKPVSETDFIISVIDRDEYISPYFMLGYELILTNCENLNFYRKTNAKKYKIESFERFSYFHIH